MALFIVTNLGDELAWHVGEPAREVNPSQVSEVQADGDELELILSVFTNLPHTNARIQSWFGDSAKQIVSTLQDGSL